MNAFPFKPVLVTGASGFVGRRLVRRLAADHCRVFCLVRPHSIVDELRSTGAELILGDVTDRGSIEPALAASGAGMVFHLAGLVRVLRWGGAGDDFASVNAGGVETVAAACAERAEPPVLVVVSSLAAAGPCEADRPRGERDAERPVSSYGRSKLAGELAAARYAGKVPITVVRPPIVFGPGDRAMLEVFRPIARWGVHLVPGWRGGDRSVSLIHVDDLIEGLLLVAAKGERLNERGPQGQGVYFMGGDDRLTYAELGRSIAKALGRKPSIVLPIPGPLFRVLGIGGDVVARVRRRPGWINSDKVTEALTAGSWTCSSAKARQQLGWSAATAGALDTRLDETVEWYRNAGWL